METRLDLILQKTESRSDLKSSLQELIKENENLKRIIVAKNLEIEKNEESIIKLQKKTVQLNKKINALKIQKYTHTTQTTNEKEKDETDINYSLLDELKIPITIDWRVKTLKAEFSSYFIRKLRKIFNK